MFFLIIGLSNVQAEEPAQFKDAGLLYYELGDYKKAYDHYSRLFLENPQDKDINFRMGQAAFAMGDYEAAVMAFERVLILDPEATEVKIELGKSYYRLGSEVTAIQYLEESLEGDLPENIRQDVQAFLQDIKKNQEQGRR